MDIVNLNPSILTSLAGKKKGGGEKWPESVRVQSLLAPSESQALSPSMSSVVLRTQPTSESQNPSTKRDNEHTHWLADRLQRPQNMAMEAPKPQAVGGGRVCGVQRGWPGSGWGDRLLSGTNCGAAPNFFGIKVTLGNGTYLFAQAAAT